jgi:phage-related tail protein
VPDARISVTRDDLQKQFDLLLRIRDKITETDDTINQIRDLREQINTINKHLNGDPRAKAVAEAGKSLDQKMTEVEEALIQTKAKSGQDVLNFPIRLNNQLVALGGVVGSASSAPTRQSYEVFDMLSKAVDEQLSKWKVIVATDLKAYEAVFKQQEIPTLILLRPAGQN